MYRLELSEMEMWGYIPSYCCVQQQKSCTYMDITFEMDDCEQEYKGKPSQYIT